MKFFLGNVAGNYSVLTKALVELLPESLAVLQALRETLGFPRVLKRRLGWFGSEWAGLRREEVMVVLRWLCIVL